MLRDPINPNELFVGAIVQQVERETITCVVMAINDNLVDLVDIYGWNDMYQFEDAIIVPKHLDGFVLGKLGFIRLTPKGAEHFINESGHETIELFGETGAWELIDGGSKVPIKYAHQLQQRVKELFGVELRAIPPKEEDEGEV